MPGRPGGVAPGGRTATHTESTLYQDRAVLAGRHQCPNVGRKAVLLAWRDGEAQIEQTFQNLDRCLKAAGAIWADVVKTKRQRQIVYTVGQLTCDIDGNCVGKGDMRAGI
jgi:hypothetical protein